MRLASFRLFLAAALALGIAQGAAAQDARLGLVPSDTFAELKKHSNDQEIVEVTVTAAFHGKVSKITRSLAVKLEPNAGKTAYGSR